MITRSLAATGCLIAALGVVACGGEGDEADPAATEGAAKEVTIYSSYPLQGAGRAQSIAAVNGAKLALEQAGGKAGNVSVTYEPLDDATAQAANWTPEQTSACERAWERTSASTRSRRLSASGTSSATIASSRM